jgi:hypothetical protein
VLEVLWEIHAKAKRWEACIEIARTLTQLVPTDVNNRVHLAYSTQQAKGGGLEAAVVILTCTVDKFKNHTHLLLLGLLHGATKRACRVKNMVGPSNLHRNFLWMAKEAPWN